MKKRNCYLFVFDGYADWEPALAIAILNKYSDFAIHTFSMNGQPVQSMGNIIINPDLALTGVPTDETDLLIIPGGDIWEQGGNNEVTPLVNNLLEKQRTVAAICGATLLLARHHHLDNIRHTSNGIDYLQNLAPEYKGQKFYENKPCVDAGNIITANGAAMIDFAITIARHFTIADTEMIDKIADLYKSAGMNNRF